MCEIFGAGPEVCLELRLQRRRELLQIVHMGQLALVDLVNRGGRESRSGAGGWGECSLFQNLAENGFHVYMIRH